LAHIVVSKYDDHLPLYRQAEIFAREGVELETSTLSGWVGATAAALQPLIYALAADGGRSEPTDGNRRIATCREKRGEPDRQQHGGQKAIDARPEGAEPDHGASSPSDLPHISGRR
jgi:hypothetical protein